MNSDEKISNDMTLTVLKAVYSAQDQIRKDAFKEAADFLEEQIDCQYAAIQLRNMK